MKVGALGIIDLPTDGADEVHRLPLIVAVIERCAEGKPLARPVGVYRLYPGEAGIAGFIDICDEKRRP